MVFSSIDFGRSRPARTSSAGGHGFGLIPNATQAPGDWPGRAELWLRARKLMP